MTYIYDDLVLCKHDESVGEYLFVAPSFTHLQKGDDIIVDTKYGHKHATVIDSITIDTKSDAYRFIRSMNKERELKKVVGKVVTLKYEEDEDGTDHN